MWPDWFLALAARKFNDPLCLSRHTTVFSCHDYREMVRPYQSLLIEPDKREREREREREAFVSVVDASRKKVYLPFTSRLGTVQAEFAIHRHCNCPVKRRNESSMGDGCLFGFRDKDRDMFREQRVKWQGIRRRVRLFRIKLGLSLG